MSTGSRRGAGGWLRTLHQWHWVSSAASLVGMLLFAVTGITLNHAGSIEAKPVVETLQVVLPSDMKTQLQAMVANEHVPAKDTPVPAAVSRWLRDHWAVNVDAGDVEWSAEELYISLPRPGGDAWLRIDLPSGQAEYEVTDRGWVSWLNDLHKGRHTGAAWSLFIDVLAVSCLLFCITGLLILKYHATNRPGTWPLVGLGLMLPALIALLLIH